MAAEFEEVIDDAYPIEPHHLHPDAGDDLFFGRACRDVAALELSVLSLRRRQRPPVDLAVGRQRQCVQHDKGRWDHILRHSLSEIPPQLPYGGAALTISNKVGHQPPTCRLISSHQHYRLSHGRMLREHRLDLSQLDAESPDLHLVVDSPQELQVSIRQVPSPIARPVNTKWGLGAGG